jgi:uncharacterized iron-regulated membrane protein
MSHDDEVSPATPYLVILGLALVVGLILAVYLWLNRGEILAIFTQSPP